MRLAKRINQRRASLFAREPKTPKALADPLRIERTAMVALLDDLEHKRHVERQRHPRDRPGGRGQRHRVPFPGPGSQVPASVAMQPRIALAKAPGERCQPVWDDPEQPLGQADVSKVWAYAVGLDPGTGGLWRGSALPAWRSWPRHVAALPRQRRRPRQARLPRRPLVASPPRLRPPPLQGRSPGSTRTSRCMATARRQALSLRRSCWRAPTTARCWKGCAGPVGRRRMQWRSGPSCTTTAHPTAPKGITTVCPAPGSPLPSPSTVSAGRSCGRKFKNTRNPRDTGLVHTTAVRSPCLSGRSDSLIRARRARDQLRTEV
jgi:hypothetical protein